MINGEFNQEKNFPIVGIGSSAGGLEALKTFFINMPADSDMAFVLVTHLDPNRKSILSEIITKFTKMKVEEVEDGDEIKKNHTYILPPNKNLMIRQKHLYLSAPDAPRGLRLPINFFFRSLAEDQKEHAICIILSGTGTDGTIGLREIKGAGGMVVVQDPQTAKYDGMPRSAIGTGIVDFILPPVEIPKKLITYVSQFLNAKEKSIIEPKIQLHDRLPEIFNLLNIETGYDFSKYKINTLRRRIERRMTVTNVLSIDEYLAYLKEHPNEINTLFRDLLIGVTSFFRDKKAFNIIKDEIIPLIIKNVDHKRTIRVWIPACSTGEEVYSIAILLYDYLDNKKLNYKLQIFGTDADKGAINAARQGIYPNGSAMDIPPEYIKKYFNEEDKKLKIKKKIRNLIVFAVQNLISDPPFSKMDLISCRNLLIYLKPDIQKDILHQFYYSLNRNGYLFLGSSESISSVSSFYSVVDSKWKIFQKVENLPSRDKKIRSFPPLIQYSKKLKIREIKEVPKEKDYANIIFEFLMNKYTPPAVIINKNLDILYFHGQTGKFLAISEGKANFNINEMAREGYRLELRSAIRKAEYQKKGVLIKNIKIKSNGDIISFNLQVIPYFDNKYSEGLFIIIFEEMPQEKSVDENGEIIESFNEITDERVKELEDELNTTKQQLQTIIEELETSNEELKSTNEELQSSNEELQSTNEELQTSKEELQSINEELITVNSELEIKIKELSLVNNDLANLIASTETATIFLDMNLKIKRFTPYCTRIFNLVESDIARPIYHITHKLKYDSLIEDVYKVKENLIPIQLDVEDKNNSWYSLRIFPYQTLDNEVDGVVINFFDITKRKKIAQKLEKSEKKYKEAYTLANFYKDILVHDMNNILQIINSSIEYFSISPNEPEKMKQFDKICEIIKNQVKRGAILISNIAKLSKIDENKAGLILINIKKILNKAIEDQIDSFQDKKITVNINGLTDEMMILGDNMLISVFENILNNGIKFNSNEENITIDIEISRLQIEGIDYIKFEFKDYGIGIRDEKKQNIFMRKSSRDILQKGMGMGLSLVYKIVQRYDGKIWIEDRVKGNHTQGSNFIVLLRAPTYSHD